MFWLIAILLLVALPVGAFVGWAGKLAWHWGAVAFVTFPILVALLVMASEPAPATANWSPAGFVGDLAYWSYQVSLLLACLGVGVILGRWSKRGGEARQVAAQAIGTLLTPAFFVVWALGSFWLNCSYSYGQIGHACY